MIYELSTGVKVLGYERGSGEIRKQIKVSSAISGKSEVLLLLLLLV